MLREKADYNREGWGMCTVKAEIVTSDGTSELVAVTRSPCSRTLLSRFGAKAAGFAG